MFSKIGQIRPGYLSRYFCTALQNGNNRYDVVIVGGGMVGFGLAALAASSSILQGKRILLLENMPKKSYHMRDTFEARVVALSCSSQSMLQKLNAWEFVQSKRAQPVKAMKVWEDKSNSFLVFERDPLAYIVENDLVIESLRLVADKALNPVTVEYNAHVDEIELPSSDNPYQLARVHVRSLQNDRSRIIETNLVVGADGVNSKVRQVAGLQTISWDHGQAAVVATLCKSERNEPFTAWQRFVGNGPIALLPLSDDCSSLTWSTTNEEADRLLSMSETDFVQSLNHALTKPNAPTPLEAQVLSRFGQLLAGLVDQFCGHAVTPSSGPATPPTAPQICNLQSGSKRMKFPLGFQHANNYDACRAVLVGDAAHRILPLAGQGVNLGFGDVISLVQRLEEAVAQGADLGNAMFLQEYTSDRQREVGPIAATMELLNFLYSTDAFALKLSEILHPDKPSVPRTPASYAHQLYARVLTTVRSAGLNTVQSSALIKDFLMNAAITGQIGVSPSDV